MQACILLRMKPGASKAAMHALAGTAFDGIVFACPTVDGDTIVVRVEVASYAKLTQLVQRTNEKVEGIVSTETLPEPEGW
jgi:hypothetical protein